MTTNQDTNAVGAGVGEEELSLRPTREQEIRNRAYEIYLQRGAGSGDETQDWLQAEREFTDIRPTLGGQEP